MWAQLSKGGVGLQDTPPGRPNPHKNQQDRGGGGGSAGGGGYQQRHHGKQQGRQSQGHMGGPSLQQAAEFLQNTPKLQQSNQQHDKVSTLHRGTIAVWELHIQSYLGLAYILQCMGF